MQTLTGKCHIIPVIGVTDGSHGEPIKLGPKDSALVFREEGILEVIIPPVTEKCDPERAPDSAVFMTALSLVFLPDDPVAAMLRREISLLLERRTRVEDWS